MSRIALPLQISDLSDFAKSLRKQLAELPDPPGHVEMLNVLSRSAGFRNYQHLKSALEARLRLEAPVAPVATIDHSLVERAARLFDADGRLLRWPTSRPVQDLCLWVLWSRLTSRTTFSEKQISELIKHWHLRRSRAAASCADRLAPGAKNPRWQRISTHRAKATGGAEPVAGTSQAASLRRAGKRAPTAWFRSEYSLRRTSGR